MKTFKNRIALLIFSFFFIGLSITSCSNDAETPVNTTNSILGRWALDKRSFTANDFTTPEEDYENNQPGCALNDYMEFKQNSVFENGYYDPNCAITPNVGGEWTKTDNNIFISFPADPDENETFELISLSPTQMKIRVDMTGREGSEPGVILFVNFTLVKVN